MKLSDISVNGTEHICADNAGLDRLGRSYRKRQTIFRISEAKYWCYDNDS